MNEFIKYLDELIEHTGLDYNEVFDKIRVKEQRSLSATDLLLIAKNLNVDPILLWQKKLDFDVMKSNKNGKGILPAMYSEYRGSSMTSLKNVLEQFKRYDLYEYALTKIQMDENTLSKNSTVSILAINNLLNYGKNFFKEKDFLEISQRNASAMYSNILFQEVDLNISKINRALHFLELVKHFETNWDYEIKRFDLNSVTIQTSESDNMRSVNDYNTFTNDETTLSRFNFSKYALAHLGADTYRVNPNSDWNNKERKFSFTIELR